MQTYTFYNASLFGQRIPGGTLLAPGDSVVVTRPSADLDPAWDALHYRAALVGLIAVNAADAALLEASALSPAPTYASYKEGGETVATTTRAVLGSPASGDFTLTLPDAGSFGANTLYAFNDGAGGNDFIIDHNVGDTIDGLGDPITLTPAANTLRFVSDGVSNWTTY